MSAPSTSQVGWLYPLNTDKGLIPRYGLLTSEIATIVGEDAYQIRERIRTGSLPGVRLHDEWELVVAYAMTFSDIARHFILAQDQKLQLRTYPTISVVPSADNEYRHRLTFSNDVMSYVPLRTEFPTLNELKSENQQTFITEVDESDWPRLGGTIRYSYLFYTPAPPALITVVAC